jgi:mitochondrial fission protein ELM1
MAEIGSCWVVSEGHAGMENQAVGLAERLGAPFQVKRVHPRAPWVWLPAGWWPAPLLALRPDSSPFAPPWPDLLISSGRRSAPYSLLARRESRGRTFTVHIQNPQARLDRFDLVAPPRHDRLSAPNVVSTFGALHRVTRERLAAEAEAFRASVAHLPRPLVAVLIGGPSRAYQMTTEAVAGLAQKLRGLGAGLAVTPSRRTGEMNLATLRSALAGAPAVIWDFVGPNPYFGWLGLADAIVATADSVSMISEACFTGKPVLIAELPGGSPKFRAFHAGLRAAGFTRPFEGRLESWTYQPLDDTGTVAAEVRRRFAARELAA